MNRRAALSYLAGMMFLPLSRALSDINAQNYETWVIGAGVQSGGSFLARSPSRPGQICFSRPKKRTHAIQTSFLPHSFAFSNQERKTVVTFEKWGTHCAQIDLDKMKLVQEVRSEEGYRFFGHGVTDGRFVYATQMNDKKKQGSVAVLDLNQSLKKVNELETDGTYPHDCQWDQDQKSLLVLNSRRQSDGPSSLVWIDCKTGKINRRVELGNNNGGYAHFKTALTGEIIVTGSTDERISKPLIALIDVKGNVRSLKFPASENPVGEALNSVIDESRQLVAISLPKSNAVHVWNFNTGTHLRKLSIKEPRAMIFSREQNCFAISSANSRTWQLLESEFVKLTQTGKTAGNGSHGMPI